MMRILSERNFRLFGAFLLLPLLVLAGARSGSTEEEVTGGIYLPILNRSQPAPALYPITNADQDNVYSVNWQAVAGSSYYVLERDITPSFTNPTVVYTGGGVNWNTPAHGITPGTYYHRVKAVREDKQGPWSGTQAVTIYPRFVGLAIRWDGAGYIQLGGYDEVGLHRTVYHDALTEADVVRVRKHSWYDPNPLGFDESYWESFFSASTGYFVASSVPADPAWKWDYYNLLPYNVQLTPGQTIQIEGQPFVVSGPHEGVTAFGRTVHYWQLVNTTRFVFYDDGSEWTQRVNPGDIVLHYHAGHTRLLLHRDTTRHIYEDGDLTPYYVRYVDNLTYATSFTPEVAPPPLIRTAPATPLLTPELEIASPSFLRSVFDR